MDYTILINKQNSLPIDYVPDNLVEYPEYNGVKIDSTVKTLIVEHVLYEFYKMNEDAFKSGYYFILDSGYRSYEYQEKVLAKNICEKGEEAYSYVALPGSSEHQSGLAIDVALKRNGEYTDQFDDSCDEIKWLHENCYKYGFILRYPKGKKDITGFNYECWHIRYVGLELSTYMHDNSIETLEEYYSLGKKIPLKK